MTFPRIRLPGMWVLGSVIAPAEMEALDLHQFEALDGFGGGAYAPSDRLVVGGAGVDFTGGTGADPLGPLTSTAPSGSGASGIVATGDGGGDGGFFTTLDGVGVFARALGTGVGLAVQAANPLLEAALISSLNANPGLVVGSVGGDAIRANGGATGNGIVATGGSTSGTGVVGQGGGPNGTGVHGLAASGGTGSGVHGESAGSGAGVEGTATSTGPAVHGRSSGSAPAGFFEYTGFNGDGLEAVGAGTGAGGRFSAGTATGVGLDVVVGGLRVQTNNGGPSVNPGNNVLWAELIPKAWGAVITDGVGGISTTAGVNYTVSLSGAANHVVNIAFVNAMLNDKYHVSVQPVYVSGISPGGNYVEFLTKTNSGFSFESPSIPGGNEVEYGTAVVEFSFAVFGVQL